MVTIKGLIIMGLIEYAKSFIGVRYQWGGNGGGAFDCSGFVQEVLSCEGLDPGGDQTAQQLYNYFTTVKGYGSAIQKRSLLFFGGGRKNITHCAIAIGHSQMIEAAGGGRDVLTEADAIRANAMVRIRPILSRSDLVAAVVIPPMVNYEEK